MYSIIKQINLENQNSDIIVIPQKYYPSLISMWLPHQNVEAGL